MFSISKSTKNGDRILSIVEWYHRVIRNKLKIEIIKIINK
jgi:hypothetical protein